MKRIFALAAILSALAAPGAARAGGPSMLLGVAEDDGVRSTTLVAAKAHVGLVRLLGFQAIRISAPWWRLSEPTGAELGVLGNTAKAAGLNGLPVFVAVYNPGSRWTPLTEEERDQFASYAATIARRIPSLRNFIIGNEPNLNGSWMPQYNGDGSNAAAPAYLELLATTYDALKRVSPRIRVIGGALSPRGQDKYPAPRHTHSPTTFIRDLGAAYRASGRMKPIMDEFAIHPYQDTSSQPPTTRHTVTRTITIADYPKLVTLLGEAFDGTAQRGSSMPIVYGEYGVESRIPQAKAKHYQGKEPTTTKPVPERTQASYYRQALQIAFCQPTVRAMFLFHLYDEKSLPRWQSGLYYADRTPKPVVGRVRSAMRDVRGGVAARCAGLRLRVKARAYFGRAAKLARAQPIEFRVRCNIDCAYVARVERLPGHATALVARGRALGGVLKRTRFARRQLPPGRYRVAVSLIAPVNPGPPTVAASVPFRVALETNRAVRTVR
ncbi:MAG: hypothetical protein M3322_02315 [Actinomycetota bacterium]|nr:hypothetical protein [Actinomycetota bacterium]